MKRSILLIAAVCLVSVSNRCDAARGQRPAAKPRASAADQGREYYYDSTPKVEKRSISQQKAQHRARQRMARLDAMRWYGFSASRPTATAIPFTSMYSPSWQQPGGRPFAWYHGRQHVDQTRTFYRY